MLSVSLSPRFAPDSLTRCSLVSEVHEVESLSKRYTLDTLGMPLFNPIVGRRVRCSAGYHFDPDNIKLELYLL